MELRRSIRILALGTTLALSAAGMPAVHVLAAPHPGVPLHPVAPVQTSAKPVEGGSTGLGPADDAECEKLAGFINSNLEDAQQELNENGMTGYWSFSIKLAQQAETDGENEGCFFVNPVTGQ